MGLNFSFVHYFILRKYYYLYFFISHLNIILFKFKFLLFFPITCFSFIYLI